MPCPHTSQQILYETELYTSRIWNVFAIFKDNHIIFLSVMPEWTTLLCAQTNLCATVMEEINIVVASSKRNSDILEMNWKDTNAGDTEADINNALIYTWVMSLFSIGMLFLWRHLLCSIVRLNQSKTKKAKKSRVVCVSQHTTFVWTNVCVQSRTDYLEGVKECG